MVNESPAGLAVISNHEMIRELSLAPPAEDLLSPPMILASQTPSSLPTRARFGRSFNQQAGVFAFLLDQPTMKP